MLKPCLLPFIACLTLIIYFLPRGWADPPAPSSVGEGSAELRIHRVRFDVVKPPAESGRPTTLLAWSPDGKRVVSSDGRGVCLWDMPGAREGLSLPTNHGGTLAIAFGDSAVFTAGKDGAVQEWDPAGGKRRRPFQGHNSSVHALALSRDGKLLLSGGADSTARLWNLGSGKELRRFERPKTEGIYGAALSHDGNRVATAGYYTVCVWDANSGGLLRRIEGFPPPLYTGIHFTPDGRRLVAGTRTTCYVWDARSGKELLRFAWEADYGTHAASAISPDGKVVALGTSLYDLTNGKPVRHFGDPLGPQVCSAFSPDGKWLAAGFHNATFCAWEVATGKVQTAPIPRGHRTPVFALAVSADGKMLATAAADRTVRVWDVPTKSEIRAFPVDAVPAIAFLPDDGRLLVPTKGGSLRSFDVRGGRELPAVACGDGVCLALAVAPGGKLVAVGGRDGIRLVDAVAGKVVRRFPWAGGKAVAVCLGFSPDGGELVGAVRAEDEGEGAVWAVCLHRLHGGDKAAAAAVLEVGEQVAGFSPDGKYLAVIGASGLRMLSQATGRELPWSDEGQPGTDLLAFSPGGHMFASHADWPAKRPEGLPGWWQKPGSVYLRESATRQLRVRLDDHTAATVKCLAFSPDGRFLVGSNDTSVLIWDLFGAAAGTKAKLLTRKDLARRWEELVAADGVQAFRAIRALVQDPARAVPFLAEKLEMAPRPKPAAGGRLRQLVADLDNRRFAVREQAMRELVAQGEPIAPILARELQGDLPLEARRRLTQVLHQVISARIPPDRLRLLRVAEVLDRIGTAEARRLLRDLEPN